jgi:Fe2+ transport system protein B
MISLPLVSKKFVILAGNPNSGKSTLFNLLTGPESKGG